MTEPVFTRRLSNAAALPLMVLAASTAVVIGLVLGSTSGHAQTAPPAAKAPTKPMVAMVLPRDDQDIEVAFKDYLVRRGIDARLERVRFSGRSEDAPALVEQVRKLKPDLIYSWGTPTTLALAGRHDAPNPIAFIRDTPIVFTEVTDPIGSGLLAQLDPPGRNVTGVSHVAPLPVQISALSSYRPFTRLGYITNPKEANSVLVRDQLRQLAQKSRFELLEAEVPVDGAGNPDPAALPGLVNRLAERKVEFLYIGPSTFLAFTHRDVLTQAALTAKLPTFCATESIVRKSQCMFGLFSSGSNVGRFAGYKAAQVLLGSQKVERIPAQTLQRFSLLVNWPVAKELRLYPPLGLLDVAEILGSPQVAAASK
jgi:putative ABC transport system substrate-binding protein